MSVRIDVLINITPKESAVVPYCLIPNISIYFIIYFLTSHIGS